MEVGIVTSHWDYITVELKNGKKVRVNESSIKDIKIIIGKKLIGEIIEGEFKINTQINYEANNIISGVSAVTKGAAIQAAASYLRGNEGTGASS